MKQKSSSTQRYPNKTMKLLFERGSCRNYLSKKIPKKVLNQVLEAGTHAPTGGNLQPYSIIKIEKKRIKEKLATMCFQKFMAKAPVHLLFCMDLYRLKKWAELEVAPYNAHNAFRCFWISFQDTVICAQNICTAADAMGLGSVYIGTIMEFPEQVKKMFGLPKGVFPVVLLCMGYPVSKPVIRRKLGTNAVVHDEKYRSLPDQQLLGVFNEKYPGKHELKKEYMPRIKAACTEVHGPAFADKCISNIKKNGYVKPAQHYFSMKYPAHQMPMGNHYFVGQFKKYGFHWFEQWIPRTRKRRKEK
jgi:nitroreductase